MSDAATIADQLAEFAATAEVPAEVRVSVQQRILDTLGICVAARALPTSSAVEDVVVRRGGVGNATIIGVPGTFPPASAALVNGVLAHSLDFDDTHLPSILHPSASVVPAVLAAAQDCGAGGRAVVDAIAVGLEICCRVGMGGYDRQSNSNHYFDRGQHATSMCGAIGSAAGVARVLGADAPQIRDALGIAASMASGIIEANRAGGTVKRVHCGWAAHAGVSAAELAVAGITGPPSAFEGRFGFFQAFISGNYDADAILDGLGEAWEVPGIFFKPYPANHFTHTVFDAAAALAAGGLRPDDIESLLVEVSSATVRTIGEPIERKRCPATAYEAQFSAPYIVAAAFHGGGDRLGHDDFSDELANDPARRALMAKVSVAGSPECDAIYPHQFPAILTATRHDGTTVREAVMTNLGGPSRPLSEGELLRKFHENADGALGAERASALAEALLRLDQASDLGTLAELLQGVPS